MLYSVIQSTRLNKAQEAKLAWHIARGSKTASEALFNANVPLAIKIANDFYRSELSLDDLTQEAMLGLLEATITFNPKKGKFANWAGINIRKHIHEYIWHNSRLTYLPHSYRTLYNKISAIETKYFIKYRVNPTLNTLAKLTGKTAYQLQTLKDLYSNNSLDAEVNEDSFSLLDTIADPNTIEPFNNITNKDQQTHIKYLLSKLSRAAQVAIILRYGLFGHVPKNLPELSTCCGISMERVRQIIAYGLNKMKKELGNMDKLGIILSHSSIIDINLDLKSKKHANSKLQADIHDCGTKASKKKAY